MKDSTSTLKISNTKYSRRLSGNLLYGPERLRWRRCKLEHSSCCVSQSKYLRKFLSKTFTCRVFKIWSKFQGGGDLEAANEKCTTRDVDSEQYNAMGWVGGAVKSGHRSTLQVLTKSASSGRVFELIDLRAWAFGSDDLHATHACATSTCTTLHYLRAEVPALPW